MQEDALRARTRNCLRRASALEEERAKIEAAWDKFEAKYGSASAYYDSAGDPSCGLPGLRSPLLTEEHFFLGPAVNQNVPPATIGSQAPAVQQAVPTPAQPIPPAPIPDTT